MFNRLHHRHVATVLEALDGGLLDTHRCWFGGGTAIVLRHGEYRESADIDFLVSDIDGYRELRELISDDGINALTRSHLTPLRDIRADQYGIRTYLDVDGSPIKFEIIHEGRITLGSPESTDLICGVKTLSVLDMAASKLLANADRWTDPSTHSRDIIDLAMLAPPQEILDAAINKAANAYGTSIERCLNAAIDHLGDNPHRLGECMRALRMLETPTLVLCKALPDFEPNRRVISGLTADGQYSGCETVLLPSDQTCSPTTPPAEPVPGGRQPSMLKSSMQRIRRGGEVEDLLAVRGEQEPCRDRRVE